MDLYEWKTKNANARKYAHFDEKVSLDKVWDYISDPTNIVKHGFYPFIHYEKKFNKFTRKDGRGYIKEKSRHLCYSAHIDRYIYSYYGYLLNQKYNKYLEERNMNLVAVAYRDNLHKNNIHFAKRAFDCIRETKESFVIIGDFSHFFDSLDHGYLKKRMCDVLKVDMLSSDFYAVFKNITKYSIWELTELLKLNNLTDTEEDIQILNSKRKVLSEKDFKKHKKEFIIRHNELSEDVEVDKRISCICVLNKGVILPVNKNGLTNVSLLPDENTVYGIFNNANDALLLFYLILTQILNSITIFPPDMVAYAQSTAILDTSFSIPADYVPDDGTISVMDNMVRMSEIKTLKEYGTRMLSGKLKKEEFLEHVFGTYIPSLKMMHGSLDLVPMNSTLNYFGKLMNNKVIIDAYKIYERGTKITLVEKKILDDLENFMYAIYDSHREEMLKNNK